MPILTVFAGFSTPAPAEATATRAATATTMITRCIVILR